MSSSNFGSSSPSGSSPPRPALANVIRDGRTKETARLSAGVRANLHARFTYYVKYLLNSQWILCDAEEAKGYDRLGMAVYESYHPFNKVTEWVDPRPAPNMANAFANQLASIDNVLDAHEEAADPELAEERRKEREAKFAKISSHTKNSRKSPITSPKDGKKKSPGAGGAGAGLAV